MSNKLSYDDVVASLNMNRHQAKYSHMSPKAVIAMLGSALRNAGLELCDWPSIPPQIVAKQIKDYKPENAEDAPGLPGMLSAFGIIPTRLSCTACGWSEVFMCGGHDHIVFDHGGDHTDECEQFKKLMAECEAHDDETEKGCGHDE